MELIVLVVYRSTGGKNMLFIEKKNFIKPEYTKHTSYIQAFNIEFNKNFSFFLKSNDWDEFTNYMVRKRPEILLELEYPIEG